MESAVSLLKVYIMETPVGGIVCVCVYVNEWGCQSFCMRFRTSLRGVIRHVLVPTPTEAELFENFRKQTYIHTHTRKYLRESRETRETSFSTATTHTHTHTHTQTIAYLHGGVG
jgi:hypothetical protein